MAITRERLVELVRKRRIDGVEEIEEVRKGVAKYLPDREKYAFVRLLGLEDEVPLSLATIGREYPWGAVSRGRIRQLVRSGERKLEEAGVLAREG